VFLGGENVPKVSIIIPVYNVEEYLAECLDSVIRQTEKDIEIICIEDCSTDSSLKILQEYAKKDNRIVVIQNEENSGQSVARNKGLVASKGEYILFVDSDDFIEPNLLEETLKYANDVDMVFFDLKKYDIKQNYTKNDISLLPTGEFSANEYYLNALLGNYLDFGPCTKLYKRGFLVENNIRFPEDIIYEDVLFNFFCMISSTKVYSIGHSFYIYRIRPNSTMTSKLEEKNIKDHFFSLYKLSEMYISEKYSNELNVIIEKYIQKLERDYVRLYRKYFYQNLEKTELINQDDTKPTKLQRVFSNAFMGLTDYTMLLNNKLSGIPKRKTNIIVYGAGEVAREVINCCDLNDIPIMGVAVSDTQNNRKSLMGNPVRKLSDYKNIKEDCLVIIAVSSKFSSEIEDYLKKQGFKNYIKLF